MLGVGKGYLYDDGVCVRVKVEGGVEGSVGESHPQRCAVAAG